MQGDCGAHSQLQQTQYPPAPGKKWMVIMLLPRAAAETAMGSPGVSVVKKAPSNVGDTGDTGSTPGLGRSPGEGKGNPLQYSFLENRRTEVPGGLQSMGSELDTSE